jgi:hypothetical protein
MSEAGILVVDFEGIPLILSSFADEGFGKIFLLISPIKFMQRVFLQNMSDIVESLINKAIAQRMKVGISDV